MRFLLSLLLVMGAILNVETMVQGREANSSADIRHIAWTLYGNLENAPSDINTTYVGRCGSDSCPAFDRTETQTGKGRFRTITNRGSRGPIGSVPNSETPKANRITASGPGTIREVAQENNSYLINFSAKWCGPCKAFHPTLEKLQKEGYNVTMVDGEDNPDITKAWGVDRYPTTFLVKNDKVVKKWVGAVSERELKKEYGPKDGT